jgi:hypothetical protein
MRLLGRRLTGRLAAGALAAAALWAGGGASGDDAPPPPTRGDAEDDGSMVALRRELERQAQALRASLDAQESGRGWSELLERRRSVDGLLLPLHLVRDAVRATARADAPVDLLAVLRTEWQEGAAIERWSHPRAPERARAALSAWSVPGRGAWIEVTAGSDAWVGCDAPATLRWSAEARPGPDGVAVDARCWWGFPTVAQARSDFPLPSDGIDLRWDEAGASYRDDRGGAHAERWHSRPIFNNPPDLYAVFDSLRTVRAPDAAIRAAEPSADAATPEATGDVLMRTVSRPDGRVLTVERWRFEGGRLREIAFDLRPRMLRHHAERGVEIATEAEGTVLGRSPYRATSEIEDLPRGATVVLAFREPAANTDRVADGARPGATVPDRLEWVVGGVRRTWARFESVRAADGERDDGDRDDGRDARIGHLASGLSDHRSAMHAFDEAIRSGGEDAFLDASRAIAARHESAGLADPRRADEWWIAAARLAGGGRPDRAAAVLAGRWRDLAHTPGHAPSAGGCESADMGAIAGSVANVAFEPAPKPADSADATDPIRCGTAARHPSMQSMLDAIARAIGRARLDAEAARCMMQAVCRASDDPAVAAAVAGLDPATAHGIEQELSDALLSGDLPLPEAVTGMAGAHAASDECRDFAARVMERAIGPVAPATTVTDARTTHERASADAVRILRRTLERAGLPHDEAARIGRAVAGRLADRRRLIGNRFAPTMDPSRLRPPEDPVDMDGELLRAGLADVVARELARVEALRAVARDQALAEDVRARGQAALADSRARTAEHRIASLVERAIDRATARPRA